MADQPFDYKTEFDLRTIVFVGAVLVLPVVYVYQGTPQFYEQYFSVAAAGLGALSSQLWRFGSVLILFAVIPAVASRLLGVRLTQLGVCIGDWRYGLKVLAIAVPVTAPLLWVGSAAPDMQAEYPMAKAVISSLGLLLFYEATYLAYYVGWEFFFRGFIQLGLKDRLGVASAMAIQSVASVLLHIGKPIGETWAAVLAGPAFGFIALRTRSVLYVLAFHYYVGVLNDVFCAIRQAP